MKISKQVGINWKGMVHIYDHSNPNSQDSNCVSNFTSLMHDIDKNSQFGINYG
jgi:hypothetical protein